MVGRLQASRPTWVRETLRTPDNDVVDWDWLNPGDAQSGRPLLILFHGLEGSSSSHYAQALALRVQKLGWHLVVPHFRGCAGSINLAPRAYHAGDAGEVNWTLQRVRERYPRRPRFAVGVSLGGNALLLWAGQQGQAASDMVNGALAISAPVDLKVCGNALDQGLNKLLYTSMFLRTMKRKAAEKARQFPGLIDMSRVVRAETLRDFDDVFTAPLHGYRDVVHYWSEASAKPVMGEIAIPTCVLHALNDPFVPNASVPAVSDVSSAVELVQPKFGGHVGFWGLATNHQRSGEWSNFALAHFVTEWIQRRLRSEV